MPARAKNPRSSVPTSTKPKRETKKPTTFVPGVASSIAKPKRVVAKPKSSVKVIRKAAPKSVPKQVPKRAPKKAPKTPATKKAAPTKRVAPKASTGGAKRAKTAKRTSSRSKPRYAEMIIQGIQSLHKKSVSRQALEKYIEENFPKRTDAKKWIRLTLNRLIHNGRIQKVKASYKLSPKNATKTKTLGTKKRATKAPKSPKAKSPRKVTKKSSTATPVSATPAPAESTGQPVWQYMHGGWKDYEPEASALVEVQYQEWLNNNQMFDVRSVKSGSFEYNVDFRRMVQTNIQHPDHTERQIRRHIQ